MIAMMEACQILVCLPPLPTAVWTVLSTMVCSPLDFIAALTALSQFSPIKTLLFLLCHNFSLCTVSLPFLPQYYRWFFLSPPVFHLLFPWSLSFTLSLLPIYLTYTHIHTQTRLIHTQTRLNKYSAVLVKYGLQCQIQWKSMVDNEGYLRNLLKQCYIHLMPYTAYWFFFVFRQYLWKAASFTTRSYASRPQNSVFKTDE